jgi:hypothetical protein
MPNHPGGTGTARTKAQEETRMMDEEMRTETEQMRTRRDVVRLGAALLATGIGLASLTGAAAREREPGDDRGSGGGGLDDPAGDDRGGLNGGGLDDPAGDDRGGVNGGLDDNHRHSRRRR